MKMKIILGLMFCLFGLLSFANNGSKHLKKKDMKVLSESTDSVTFEGNKYLITYSKKSSKYTAKVNSSLKIEIPSNSEKDFMLVESYVAELKTNGVMVETPTKGADLKQFFTVIPKGESFFISKILLIDANGKLVQNSVSGFKITRLN